jgi:hypothetical protein
MTLAQNNTGQERKAELLIAAQKVTIVQRATLKVFEDVAPADVSFDAVNSLLRKAITAGCGSTPPRFCPSDTITRGQLAIFLSRLLKGGDHFSAPDKPYFTDVPPQHVYFRWIQQTAALGIHVACGSDDKFCPEQVVSRAEMAAFLVQARFLGQKLDFSAKPVYADVPQSHKFFSYIQKTKALGIAGCSNAAFCPDKAVTRAEMAGFLMSRQLEGLGSLPGGGQRRSK